MRREAPFEPTFPSHRHLCFGSRSGERRSTGGINLIERKRRGNHCCAEHAWALAPGKGDAAGMAAFMSDDYVEIEMETTPGTSKNRWVTSGKAEWVEMVRSGREKYTSVDVQNIKVYLQGDLATTTGEYSQTGTKDGKDIGATGLYVNTWVKKNGKQLVVSSVFP
jgi:ketosteroid isomerase-like protein